MGTRGLFGFYYKGKYYVVYNHFDSYPEGLGSDIINEIKKAILEGKLDEWKNKLININIVNEDKVPTSEDIERLAYFTDLSVSRGSTSDWYCLLRRTQGSLEKVLDSGYIINSVDSAGCPRFEEYAYILNFDTNLFDFYEGDTFVRSYELNNLPQWEDKEDDIMIF